MRVAVVGAGLGGLSAACHLVGKGHEVVVLERETVPGGRAGVYEAEGFRIDTGPSVLTMTDILSATFAGAGADMDEYLTLHTVDPIYRACFADGSTIRVRTGREAMTEEIRKTCGPTEAAGFGRFCDYLTELYELELPHFIDKNFDSVFDLLQPPWPLVKLVRMGGLRRLANVVGSYFSDPRLQRIFSFQSMYAGLSPYDALAIYAVIAYMDSVAGVFFPKGGMHAVPRALAGAAEKHGVDLRYGTTVTRVLVEHGRAVGVETADGERIAADVVVLNPDLPVAYRELLPPDATPRRVRSLTYSPSCFLLLAGSGQAYTKAAHHNIHFGRAWKEVFADLIDRQSLMTDPSILVTNPTHSDPSLAPDGRQIYYVLLPTPNTSAGIDWDVVGPRYRDEVVARLEALGYVGFGDGIEVEDVTTPATWQARGMEQGAPFAAAHSFFQTGPFRPSNLAPKVEGVVFAGSGTQPGVGVPMVLISGRLAAERILGKDKGYRSRAMRLASPSPVL